MTSPSERILRLLSLLQSHRHWSGIDLASRLEVSVRTVRRDVDRLRELGYPVEASPGVEGGYQLAPGAALPPLVLDDEEAVALAVGLQLATQASVAGIIDSSVRALAKLVQVMPRRLTDQVEALRVAVVSSQWRPEAATVETMVLTTLARACRDNERIEIGYQAADGAASHRTVEPLRLVRLDARWYLVAYDLSRHDWRNFRVDRITTTAVTGTRFRPRELPAQDVAQFVKEGITGTKPKTHEVEVLVHSPAPPIREHFGRWARVHPAGPDRCLLRVKANSLEWTIMVLGRMPAEFTVLAPPELDDLLREWADRFSRAVDRTTSGESTVATGESQPD